MAVKLSWIRRVSTMTTAPSAPRISSSHMNQKRVCPGVPKRYRIRSSAIVMRPKSIATVVVFFDGTAEASSTCRPAAVITASVVSGVISEMAPTMVVLPAPKPPAMRILTAVIRSELAEANENPFQDVDPFLGVARLERLVEGQDAFGDHVGDEDTGDAERDAQRHGDLGEGLGAVAAQVGDEDPVAARVPARLDTPFPREQDGLDRDVPRGLGPAAGHRVRAHESPARVVVA